MTAAGSRRRATRLIRSAIADLQLDLTGIRVLTEAASGAFAATPIMAALSGADRVMAVTRGSRWAAAASVIRETEAWATQLGVADRLVVTERRSREVAHDAQLVTNLGFVRPIDARLVERLPAGAVVALMCEPWEVRATDVDVAACGARGVPVVGTNERHPRLRTFDYVGVLALKLLLELDVEIVRSTITVLGSAPFGTSIERALSPLCGAVTRGDPTAADWSAAKAAIERGLPDCDALVLAEYRSHVPLIGGREGVSVERLVESQTPVVRICGAIDLGTRSPELLVHPPRLVGAGRMTVTTGHLGPRPVVDLHAAGLKVGELVVRGLRASGDPRLAMQRAVDSGLARGLDDVGPASA